MITATACTRREFLAAAAGASLAGAIAVQPHAASAIEPIARNGLPKFKFSLAAYSYRDLLTGKPPQLTLNDFISDCAKFGLEGTELTSYYFPTPVTHDYLRALRQQCFRLGLDISGTAVGNDFGHVSSDERRKQIDHVKQWVEFSAVLGAPVIRIFAGHQKKESTAAEAHSLMVSAIEECCDYAGRHGVHLALENHGGPTATAEGLLAFVQDVKSPWFGVNLDTGNFSGAHLYEEIEKAAPYALNVQVKVAVKGPDGKKQPADFGRVARILRAAHYRGYVALEYEEGGNPREECAKYIEQMRTAFA